MVHHYEMSEMGASTETREEIREQNRAEWWARVAADSYAEIALLHSGNDDPEHRAKVREAHERALANGSDFL
jgi:hypothetical protein